MTDSVSPASPIAQFGTSIVGKEFGFSAPSEDGKSTDHVTARAVSMLSFDETLRYTTGRHAQIVQAVNSAKEMRATLKNIGSPSGDGYMEKFNEIVEARLVHEHHAWAASIEIILIFVDKNDHDKLRPLLMRGDPKAVNELREWLEEEVLGTATEDAQRMTNVDPTSPKPPESSPSNPASGDGSDSAESSTTG